MRVLNASADRNWPPPDFLKIIMICFPSDQM
jgi:hypothetical protein